MELWRQALGSALAKQQQRDAARAKVQSLGQAIMTDEPILDDPAYLQQNPIMAAILNNSQPAETNMAAIAQNPMKALAPLLSLLPGSEIAIPANMAAKEIGTTLFGAINQNAPQAPAAQYVPPAEPLQQAPGIAEALMAATPEAAAPEQNWFSKLTSNEGLMELLLQTGLGLASGEDFGTSLSRGVQGQRNLAVQKAQGQIAAEDRKDRKRREEIENRKLEAEIRKLDADAKKMAAEARGDNDTLSDADYAKIVGDTYETLSQDPIYASRYDSGVEFLDPESKARYIANSSVRPEERRYLPLKGEYIDKIKALSDKVDAGEVPKSQLYSRLDEYVLAFGQDATVEMVKNLKGK